MVTWEYLRITEATSEVQIGAGFDKLASMCQWLKEKLSATLLSEDLKAANNLNDMKVYELYNYIRYIIIKRVNIMDILNILGSEGWEILGIAGGTIWLKRASGSQAIVSTSQE